MLYATIKSLISKGIWMTFKWIDVIYIGNRLVNKLGVIERAEIFCCGEEWKDNIPWLQGNAGRSTAMVEKHMHRPNTLDLGVKYVSSFTATTKQERHAWQMFKAIVHSIGGFECMFINLLKSAAFSRQTSENNFKPP